jgi:guanine deaminase
VTDAARLGLAVDLAVGAATGDGGPFGAVVVDAAGDVIGRGTNGVVRGVDPTAHAEVVAVRQAAAALGHVDLRGCVLYASCHPCPMCLGAAWWARVDRVVYAATPEDAAAAGFDDRRFWDAMGGLDALSPVVPLEHIPIPAARHPFDAWLANPTRVPY